MLDEITIFALIVVVIIVIAIVVIIFRLTNPNSKACKMNCKYSKVTGLNIEVKTTEKSTPSHQD